MQLTYLPILFLSGLIILCNSILFVRERYVYPSVAQIIVPISAILSLIAFGKSMGIFAVILGMVFGQFFNFILVYFALKKDNIQIFPFVFDFKMPSSFWIGYCHLIIIAIFTASLILINTYISTSLGPGAVSIFNLGTKFSMFLIGILSAVFSSVLLPYLSKLFVYQKNELLKKETYILILISTFIFIPFSMTIYLSAEWISQLIFRDIVFDRAAILGIASVIKYSFIQLPFWIFNAILFRHANAINNFWIITTSGLILLLLDLLFSFNLIKYMNVGGLALSMTLSTAITSCFILFFYIYKKYFNLIEGFFLLASWIFFGSILLKINFVRLLDLFNKAI
jgi:putative peptidoglycan lipid II flippase